MTKRVLPVERSSSGSDPFVDLVNVNLGPSRRSLVLPKPGQVPTITGNDVSVPEQIELDDPLARLTRHLVEMALGRRPAAARNP
jgi:hypothetical protein